MSKCLRGLLFQTSGRTALMEAARVGSAIVVKELLQSGADVLPVDIEENNAVHLSMVTGSLSVRKTPLIFTVDLQICHLC